MFISLTWEIRDEPVLYNVESYIYYDCLKAKKQKEKTDEFNKFNKFVFRFECCV